MFDVKMNVTAIATALDNEAAAYGAAMQATRDCFDGIAKGDAKGYEERAKAVRNELGTRYPEGSDIRTARLARLAVYLQRIRADLGVKSPRAQVGGRKAKPKVGPDKSAGPATNVTTEKVPEVPAANVADAWQTLTRAIEALPTQERLNWLRAIHKATGEMIAEATPVAKVRKATRKGTDKKAA